VKALASAMCIGAGGSVGREGPIVQIGSALGSTLGQLIGMSEKQLRIMVACGAASGIAATFNAPITGIFFGLEILLPEFSLDALAAASLAAVAVRCPEPSTVWLRALLRGRTAQHGAHERCRVPTDNWLSRHRCGQSHGDCGSWGRRRVIGPQVSSTSARAALAEWNP